MTLAALRREPEHIRAEVDSDHYSCISYPLGKFGNVEAGTASHVEDALTRLRVERIVN